MKSKLASCALVTLATVACTGSIGEGGREGVDGPERSPSCGAPGPGDSPLRRLTRWEYDNTVADVLGDTTRPASAFANEGVHGGFDNAAAGASLSPIVVEQYENAAIAVADRAIADVGSLVDCDVVEEGDEACASVFVDRVGRRLFRRALSGEERAAYASFFDRANERFGFDQAIGLVLRVFLQSPSFLYRVELGMPDAASPDALRLTPYEQATRLSYLLWGSAPDDVLLDAAESGGLDDAAGVRAQAERMLDDERGGRAIRSFYGQWAQLDALDAIERPGTPYTREMGALLRIETETFADEVIRHGDGKWETLLAAPFSFMNADLADYYGVDGPTGDDFERVALDPARHAGILTQAGPLAVQAHPGASSPVLRGKFLRDRVLCAPLPPPPDDVNATLPAPDPNTTARQQLEVLTSEGSCAGCHALLNEPGFAFDHFDEAGLWRDDERGLGIDASGDLVGTDADGPFSDHTSLLARLAGSEQVRACVVDPWFRYAQGRDRTDADACTYEDLQATFVDSGGDVRTLILALTQTPAFLYRSKHGGAE